MSRGLLAAGGLAALLCCLLCGAVGLLARECVRRGEEVERLRAGLALLEAARAADGAACALRDNLAREARNAAEQRMHDLDDVARQGAELDDGAYLDGLRGVLGLTGGDHSAAARPAGGLPASGDAGRTGAGQ
ncbi:hypothetical protein [uncultured Desulfovibrio sp.]|uniref:hypothetical protein n=1 Tax=uncultured Desulfovibrio sp. TaxID=167968 RepID=UPI00260B3213|nr:hypothetical protein [uncultured Desulfovibrio sp.]